MDASVNFLQGCNGDNQYAGYTGALQCLFDDAADVAFVKQSTFNAYVNELQTGNPDGRTDVSAAAKVRARAQACFLKSLLLLDLTCWLP